MALHAAFAATCGVFPKARTPATNARWLYPLSPPMVAQRPGNSPTSAKPASRSAVPVRRHRPRTDHQPMPVLDQHIATVGEPRRLPVGLAKEPTVRIRRRLMRLVRAPLPAKVDA